MPLKTRGSDGCTEPAASPASRLHPAPPELSGPPVPLEDRCRARSSRDPGPARLLLRPPGRVCDVAPKTSPLPRQLLPDLPVFGRLPPPLLFLLLLVLRPGSARRPHHLPEERGCHNRPHTLPAELRLHSTTQAPRASAPDHHHTPPPPPRGGGAPPPRMRPGPCGGASPERLFFSRLSSAGPPRDRMTAG